MCNRVKVKARKSGKYPHEFGKCFYTPTVDGLEIRRSPVEVGSLSCFSHYLQIFKGFLHPRVKGGNTVDGSEILLINLWRKSSINSINPSF